MSRAAIYNPGAGWYRAEVPAECREAPLQGDGRWGLFTDGVDLYAVNHRHDGTCRISTIWRSIGSGWLGVVGDLGVPWSVLMEARAALDIDWWPSFRQQTEAEFRSRMALRRQRREQREAVCAVLRAILAMKKRPPVGKPDPEP